MSGLLEYQVKNIKMPAKSIELKKNKNRKFKSVNMFVQNSNDHLK